MCDCGRVMRVENLQKHDTASSLSRSGQGHFKDDVVTFEGKNPPLEKLVSQTTFTITKFRLLKRGGKLNYDHAKDDYEHSRWSIEI
jgi:hypothetical protein